jgi:hypothetical protein
MLVWRLRPPIGPGQSFGEVRAADGIDLAVRSGSVYAVLGAERRRQDDDRDHRAA